MYNVDQHTKPSSIKRDKEGNTHADTTISSVNYILEEVYDIHIGAAMFGLSDLKIV